MENTVIGIILFSISIAVLAFSLGVLYEKSRK